MKQLLLFSLLLFSITVKADYIPPYAYVVKAIVASQTGDIEMFRSIVDIEKIANRKRHSFTEKNLIELFKTIDVNKIEFRNKNTFNTLHMSKPLNLQFDIEVINNENYKPNTIYRIIGVGN